MQRCTFLVGIQNSEFKIIGVACFGIENGKLRCLRRIFITGIKKDTRNKEGSPKWLWVLKKIPIFAEIVESYG